jgi:tetratricopeptide (TPR) repeat protein
VFARIADLLVVHVGVIDRHRSPGLLQTGKVWNGRCWACNPGDHRLADCNKLLSLQPNDAATFDSRGLIYLNMGRFDSAIEDYSSALRIEPKLASAFYGRGLARIKKGDATAVMPTLRRQRISRQKSPKIFRNTAFADRNLNSVTIELLG